MIKNSSGILVYRILNDIPEVLLVHPGGPYFMNKDAGAWSIPKGEMEPGEDMLEAAKREFKEELGMGIDGVFEPLTPVKQKNGKIVYAWSVAETGHVTFIKSNPVFLEWPPKSGKISEFPEVDKVGWFTIGEARVKINPAQVAFLDQLSGRLVNVGKE
jgi:predicted NUDIX family NTP pyrophosphohydrolase